MQYIIYTYLYLAIFIFNIAYLSHSKSSSFRVINRVPILNLKPSLLPQGKPDKDSKCLSLHKNQLKVHVLLRARNARVMLNFIVMSLICHFLSLCLYMCVYRHICIYVHLPLSYL